MTWFIIDENGYRYPVTAPGLSLGRAGDNDVVLNDEKVSRRHASIQVRHDRLWLYDRGSSNGTFVNDERVSVEEPRLLQSGDVIRLGQSQLRVEQMISPRTSKPREPEMAASPSASVRPVEGLTSAQIWQAALAGAILGLAGLAIVALMVVRPLVQSAQSTPTPSNSQAPLGPAMSATAFVLAPIEDTPTASGGTALVVAEQGRLLTAYRVVYDPNTGRPYNRKSQVLVRLPATNNEPERWYQARVVRADRARDLAVLQIFALDDGSPLPNSFRVRPAPLGGAAVLQPAAALSVISYPVEISGQADAQIGRTLALGSGYLLAILPDQSLGEEVGWLQTNIPLSYGNIGGVALDEQGRVVGLYTGAEPPEAAAEGGVLRPIEMAAPLLAGSF
ncbi:MAG: FHA domain-containing protein [Chloroflexi bacterium]|nr:FHA domain-containing protein [Chloroflexota bacterium]